MSVYMYMYASVHEMIVILSDTGVNGHEFIYAAMCAQILRPAGPFRCAAQWLRSRILKVGP